MDAERYHQIKQRVEEVREMSRRFGDVANWLRYAVVRADDGVALLAIAEAALRLIEQGPPTTDLPGCAYCEASAHFDGDYHPHHEAAADDYRHTPDCPWAALRRAMGLEPAAVH